MPAGDGTGPLGSGPMTGRAAGFCAGYPVPGYANPLPYAAAWRWGGASAWAPYGPGGFAVPAAVARGRPFGLAPAWGFGRGFARGWRGRFGRGFGRGRGRRW